MRQAVMSTRHDDVTKRRGSLLSWFFAFRNVFSGGAWRRIPLIKWRKRQVYSQTEGLSCLVWATSQKKRTVSFPNSV
jgi:hypothetical protein